MKKTIFSTWLLLIASGCSQQTFLISDASDTIKEDRSQHFFINGLGQQKEINAAEICGGIENVSKVEVQETFVNGVLRVITFGIYTPRDARVYCKKPAARD
jgi:hypothetical protein